MSDQLKTHHKSTEGEDNSRSGLPQSCVQDMTANLHDHRLRFAIHDVAQSTIVALGLVHLHSA